MNNTIKYGDKIICDKKCNINCKHNKCNKRCEELCDRKPCEERCDIRMECGHQCFGLCGERCPNICIICSPDENNFNNNKENELLYKTKCGHIFSVNKLDKYFNNEQRNIEIYRCQQCNSILLDEPRYQNQIKICFKDIQNIKNIIIERTNINILTSSISNEDLRNRILEQYQNNKIRIFDLLPENINIEKPTTSYKKNNLMEKLPIIYNFTMKAWRKNSIFKLFTLAEKFMGIEYYIDDICNRNDIKNILNLLIF